MLNRVALAAVMLSACTAPASYYPSGQPQYATASQTTQTTNGTSTQTSTSTYTYQSNEPPPQPEPASYEPPPPPIDDGPRCHERDNREMCVALGVIYDVGRMLERLEERSCGKAARVLDRYADEHEREIGIMLSLEHTQTAPRLRQFQARHEAEVSLVIAQALDLDARCGGDDRFDRAMQRIGFRGVLGAR